MPQYYTLEEAAKVLHMPLEELREKAKKKEVRAFQDRGNWRFLSQQIDEMARVRGVNSDPDLQLGDLPAKKGDSDRLAVDFSLEDDSVPIGLEKSGDKGPRSTKSGPKSPGKAPGPKSPNPSRQAGDSDVRLVLDNEMDFQIDLDSDVKIEPSGAKGGPKSSGTRPKGGPRKSKVDDSGVRLVDKPSDSDVKLDPDGKGSSSKVKGSKSPSDSDIRLQDLPSSSGKKRPREAGTITEEIDLDAEEARAAAKSPPKKSSPSRSPNAPVLPTSSPFELSEHDLNLDDDPPPPSSRSKLGGGPKSGSKKSKVKPDKVDSSSDFELIPFDSSKAPADASLGSGEIPLLSDDEVGLGDLPTPNAGNSGINLQEPADSGISLESGGSDEIEFELSLDAGSTPKPVSKKKVKPKEDDDSSSEFELSLDDAPSDDSDSEFELSLEESSDETVGLPAGGSSDSVSDNSDSEFELTLDDEGALAGIDDDEEDKDIFEETNFDVPALDEDESGSEAVALDDADTDLEQSDFEISLDDDSDSGEESGSQVVALDEEEDADDAAATIARPRKAKPKATSKIPVDDDEQGLDLEDLEGSGPRPKARKKADDEDADLDVDEDEDEVVSAAAAGPVEWGPLPAILLAPTVIVMFVVGLMGFELVQSMWGYHRPAKVGRPLIDAIARQFDDSLPKD